MYQVDEKGFFGKFGGAYVPEILYKCVTELQQAYKPIIESEEFKKEYRALLKDYVGRPSPLYYAKRMSEKYGCQLYLKREDLNHTGAHKINNTIGQILMAKKMGKTSFYFGVTDDKQFFSGSDQLMAQYAVKPSNHPIDVKIQKLIVGQKLAMVINLAKSSDSDGSGKDDAISTVTGLLTPVFGNLTSVLYIL